jgi:hypothetical protein
VLPAGYVLSRVDEHVNGRYVLNSSKNPQQGQSIEDGGRWFDFTFLPRSARPQDFERTVSLQEFLDVEAATTSIGNKDRRTMVRGHSAVCAADGVLRWAEKRTVQIALSGAGLGCEDLRHVAESLHEVDGSTWEAYRSSARDQ